MSQFMFGELIVPLGEVFCLDDINPVDDLPFSIRFALEPNDYYVPVTPEGWSAVPFVVTDTYVDNTAELLLRSNITWVSNAKLPPIYTILYNMTAEERIDMFVSVLSRIIYKIGCECILVLCDGEHLQAGYEKCKISVLAEKMKKMICENQLFNIATYWITP